MKKYILILISFVLLLFGADKFSISNINVIKPNLTVHNSIRESSDKLLATENMTYEIETSTFVDKEIVVNYPQITGLREIDNQNKNNDLIKMEALKVVDHYKNLDADINLNIDYSVRWKSPNLLSIQYFGLGNIKGAAYPQNIFYTTNIDINNSYKIRLLDVMNTNDDFVKELKEAKYVAWDIDLNNNAVEFIREDIKMYDLVEVLKYSDYIGEENIANIFSYFTEDSIGISIGVAHAIGDHAEFEIKYDKLKKNIKFENEMWRDFEDAFLTKFT